MGMRECRVGLCAGVGRAGGGVRVTACSSACVCRQVTGCGGACGVGMRECRVGLYAGVGRAGEGVRVSACSRACVNRRVTGFAGAYARLGERVSV